MPNHFTHKFIGRVVGRVAVLLGLPVVTDFADREGNKAARKLFINREDIYGGFEVRAFTPEGGESQPFGSGRCSGPELCERFWMAERALLVACEMGLMVRRYDTTPEGTTLLVDCDEPEGG